MEYSGWLIDCQNSELAELRFPAKAQSRKERKEERDERNRIGKRLAKTFASLRLCGKLLVVLSMSLAASAQTRRVLTPADILRVANVSDAQIAPHGELVAYTVGTVQGDENRSAIWLARTAGDQPRPPNPNAPGQRPERREFRSNAAPLLGPGWNASNPRWSPDGRYIAFLANHEAQNGIWVVTLENRQPRFIAPVQATNFFITYAGESMVWSTDSKLIAYISASEDESDGAARKNDDPRVIDRIQYKSRTSFSDRSRTHVWITGIDNPEPHQLTSGQFYDHALNFSPGGNEIAFISNHESDPDATNNSDIFVVDLRGQVRQVTNTKGCEYEPAWSPDGKWIAYAATKRDVTTIDSAAEDTHVWVINVTGGNGRELTAEQDRRARGPHWAADSHSIFYLASDRGQTLVYEIAVDQPRARVLFDANDELGRRRFEAERRPPTEGTARPGMNIPIQVSSFSIGNQVSGGFESGPNRSNFRYLGIAAVFSDGVHPPELWAGNPEFLRQLSAHNEGLLRTAAVNEPEQIRFKSFDGTEIQGWLMKPAGWREDRKFPLILSIHGGPHGMSGYAFNSTFQVYSARGYAVLYLNPRGSSGYGQKFSDGTLNEWGGGDYKDLMIGVDEVLKRYSWVDGDRMGVTGGSYGGFMTNWIITQTPRFKAAVSAASVSNLISFYSTSLYQDLVHSEFGGFPWDNYDLLWQWSPLHYVKQVQTPTLFIHGEQDNDVHITQTEEMYMALKRRGVDTVFVRYPREGHGLREPRHRVDALERTLAWFDRYLK